MRNISFGKLLTLGIGILALCIFYICELEDNCGHFGPAVINVIAPILAVITIIILVYGLRLVKVICRETHKGWREVGGMKILQLLIVWLMVIAVCYVLFSAPKYIEMKGVRLRYDSSHSYSYYGNVAPMIDWSFVAQRVVLIGVVGAGLILTIRVKKG